MRICIFGAGAVGGYLAGFLARGGAEVSVVARGAHLAAIRAEGLRVETPEDALTVRVAGRASTAAVTVELPGAPGFVTVTDQNTVLLAAVQGGAAGTAAGGAAATGGEKLSSESVSSLPLNGRDFSTLLLLAAGTMTDANGATNFTQQFAIDGARGVEAVFAMDGADISDPEMGGATFTNFNVDAVEEIQSSSGWMPAEVGRGAAGFTNIVTRSGSALENASTDD